MNCAVSTAAADKADPTGNTACESTVDTTKCGLCTGATCSTTKGETCQNTDSTPSCASGNLYQAKTYCCCSLRGTAATAGPTQCCTTGDASTTTFTGHGATLDFACCGPSQCWDGANCVGAGATSSIAGTNSTWLCVGTGVWSMCKKSGASGNDQNVCSAKTGSDTNTYYCFYDSSSADTNYKYKWRKTPATVCSTPCGPSGAVCSNLGGDCKATTAGVCCGTQWRDNCQTCSGTSCTLCQTTPISYALDGSGGCIESACENPGQALTGSCTAGADNLCCRANCAAPPTGTGSSCCADNTCYTGLGTTCSGTTDTSLTYLCTAEDTWTVCDASAAKACKSLVAIGGGTYYCVYNSGANKHEWVATIPSCGTPCSASGFCTAAGGLCKTSADGACCGTTFVADCINVASGKCTQCKSGKCLTPTGNGGVGDCATSSAYTYGQCDTTQCTIDGNCGSNNCAPRKPGVTTGHSLACCPTNSCWDGSACQTTGTDNGQYLCHNGDWYKCVESATASNEVSACSTVSGSSKYCKYVSGSGTYAWGASTDVDCGDLCAASKWCNGNGQCLGKVNPGNACPNACVSLCNAATPGCCSDGICHDLSNDASYCGSCTPTSTQVCGTYKCATGTCKTSCTSKADCTGTNVCIGGVCKAGCTATDFGTDVEETGDTVIDKKCCGANNPIDPSAYSCAGASDCFDSTTICSSTCNAGSPCNSYTCTKGAGGSTAYCKISCTTSQDCAKAVNPGIECIDASVTKDDVAETCMVPSATYNGRIVVKTLGGAPERVCASNPGSPTVSLSNYECSHDPVNLAANCNPSTGYCKPDCTREPISIADETGLYCTQQDNNGAKVCNHCADTAKNCGELLINAGGSCPGDCVHQGSPITDCNYATRKYCDVDNYETTDQTKYCNNCPNHCGDGVVQVASACAEQCDTAVSSSLCSADGKYCTSTCTYATDYSATSPYCKTVANGGLGCADTQGDSDEFSCKCKAGTYFTGMTVTGAAVEFAPCCGDDATSDTWMNYAESKNYICLSGQVKQCLAGETSHQKDNFTINSILYYCVKKGTDWQWDEDPCQTGDGYCYQTSCTEFDKECRFPANTACVNSYDCGENLYCKSNSTEVSKGCCTPGKCWNGNECVVPGSLLGSFVCTLEAGNNAVWTKCLATNLCAVNATKACVQYATNTYQWEDQVLRGETCYGCNTTCQTGQGFCCPNGKCGNEDGGSCSVPSECCSGNCDNDVCCPVGSVWCGTSCKPLANITQDHDCSGCDIRQPQGLCPTGYTCNPTTKKCSPPDKCSTAIPCAYPTICAFDTLSQLSYCCPSVNHCWDDKASTPGCVQPNRTDSTGKLYCQQGKWISACRGPVNLQGKCDATCSTNATDCDTKLPGADYTSYACKSDCSKTTDKLNLTLEHRACTSATNTTACLNQTAGTDGMTVDQGVAVLVSYGVSLADAPVQTVVKILVDGAVVQSFNASSGGNHPLTSLGSGTHTVRVITESPDYLDDSKELTLTVIPSFKNAVSISIKPSEVSVVKGTTEQKMNLTIVNTANYNYTSSVSTNMNTTLPGTISLLEKATTPTQFTLTPPATVGTYNLIIELSTEKGSLNLTTRVVVHEEQIYDVRLDPIYSSTDGWRVKVTNIGTVKDQYLVTHCLGTDQVSVDPGDNKEVYVGIIEEDCSFEAKSADIKKILTLKPVSLSISVPPTMIATIGAENTLAFSTTASETGTITVTSDSEMFPQFTCDATCTRSLAFTPTSPGATTVTFTVAWGKYSLTTTASSRITMSQQLSVAQDMAAITTQTTKLEADLKELEDSGITAPAVKAILDRIKASPATTAEQAAEALGQLTQAQRLLKYAQETGVPAPRELPITSIAIGAVAILVGIGAIYLAFFHENAPLREPAEDFMHTYQPGAAGVNVAVHHEHDEDAPASKMVVGPDGKTYNLPPGAQLVTLPTGRVMVVPAEMKVVKTDQGEYRLAPK